MKVNTGEAKSFREYLENTIEKYYDALQSFSDDRSHCGLLNSQIYEAKKILAAYDKFKKRSKK